MKSKIKVFATATCPKCRQVEKYFEKIGASFEVVDMASSESRAELATVSTKRWPFGLSGVREAPVIMVDREYYAGETLIKGGLVSSELVELMEG